MSIECKRLTHNALKTNSHENQYITNYITALSTGLGQLLKVTVKSPFTKGIYHCFKVAYKYTYNSKCSTIVQWYQ